MWLYDSKERVLGTFQWLTLLVNLSALSVLAIYYGYEHDAETSASLFEAVKFSFGFYVLHYLVRVLYHFHPTTFFKETWGEGLVMAVLLVEGVGEGGAVADGAVVFLDLDEMVVNLNTSGRRQSVLKIKVALELASKADLVGVQAVVPRVIDNFQTYLRELRVDDLNGSAGLYRLREELLTRVNVAVQPAKVNAILFKEMLIQ